MTQLADVLKIFPGKPTKAHFELPFSNHPAQGELTLYSTNLSKSLLVLSSLDSPQASPELISDQETFRTSFEKYLVDYLFYQPAVFRENQKLSFLPTKQGVQFQFTYEEEGDQKVLEGVAFAYGHKIYHLFYIASQKNVDQEVKTAFKKTHNELHKLLAGLS